MNDIIDDLKSFFQERYSNGFLDEITRSGLEQIMTTLEYFDRCGVAACRGQNLTNTAPSFSLVEDLPPCPKQGLGLGSSGATASGLGSSGLGSSGLSLATREGLTQDDVSYQTKLFKIFCLKHESEDNKKTRDEFNLLEKPERDELKKLRETLAKDNGCIRENFDYFSSNYTRADPPMSRGQMVRIDYFCYRYEHFGAKRFLESTGHSAFFKISPKGLEFGYCLSDNKVITDIFSEKFKLWRRERLKDMYRKQTFQSRENERRFWHKYIDSGEATRAETCSQQLEINVLEDIKVPKRNKKGRIVVDKNGDSPPPETHKLWKCKESPFVDILKEFWDPLLCKRARRFIRSKNAKEKERMESLDMFSNYNRRAWIEDHMIDEKLDDVNPHFSLLFFDNSFITDLLDSRKKKSRKLLFPIMKKWLEPSEGKWESSTSIYHFLLGKIEKSSKVLYFSFLLLMEEMKFSMKFRAQKVRTWKVQIKNQ